MRRGCPEECSFIGNDVENTCDAAGTVEGGISGPEDDARSNSAERKAAAYVAHLLRRQSKARCSDEGTARRDDRTQLKGHSGLVSEQAMQGQETRHAYEADTPASSRHGQKSSCICACNLDSG